MSGLGLSFLGGIFRGFSWTFEVDKKKPIGGSEEDGPPDDSPRRQLMGTDAAHPYAALIARGQFATTLSGGEAEGITVGGELCVVKTRRPMSALPPKADLAEIRNHVR
jgi:hypothetical protein